MAQTASLQRLYVLILLLCCALPACDGATPAGPVAASEAHGDVDLPPCGKPPSEDPTTPPPGAVLPPTARLTAVREEPPAIQLNGYVEATPAGVREWIEAQPDLDVVSTDDDGDEIQLLVTDGTWQTFVSIRAVCADGSSLAEVIAAQGAGAVLPTPAGSPGP